MPEAPRAVPEPDVSLARRLAPGIVLLAASIVITVADQVYASSSGEVLTIASLRAGWIAGTLMLAGVIWLGLGLARHFRR